MAGWSLALHAMAAPRASLLDLESRRRCYRLVSEFPGLHLTEISRELGMQANLAAYHLRRLERNGLVSSRRDAGYLRYFPREDGRFGRSDTVPRGEKGTLAVLRRPTPLRLVVELLEADELTLAQLARRTGLGAATVSYQIDRLEGLGLVATTRDGRERRCRLADPNRVQRLLMDYRPPDALVRGFIDAWTALERGLQRRGRRGETIL